VSNIVHYCYCCSWFQFSSFYGNFVVEKSTFRIDNEFGT